MNLKSYLDKIKYTSEMTIQETKEKLSEKFKSGMSEWEYDLLIKEVETYYYDQLRLKQQKENQEEIRQLKEESDKEIIDVLTYKPSSVKEVKNPAYLKIVQSKGIKVTKVGLSVYLLVSIIILAYTFSRIINEYEIIESPFFAFVTYNSIPFIIAALVLLLIVLMVYFIDRKNKTLSALIGGSAFLCLCSGLANYEYLSIVKRMIAFSSQNNYWNDANYSVLSERFQALIFSNWIAFSEVLVYAAYLLSLGTLLYVLISFVFDFKLEIIEEVKMRKSVNSD